MHVEVDCEESWASKNWCFWTVVLEKTLESPLDCKVIKSVNHKGNQSWILVGRTDAEAETPILWSPGVKSWLIRKDLDAGKGWRQEKGMTEDEMVGWHHLRDKHEFEQALGVGDGQGCLQSCSPWVTNSRTWLSDWTDWTEIFLMCIFAFVIVVEWGVCMQIFFHFIISFFFFLLLNFKILHISWLVELYYIYVLQIFEIII